MSRGLLVITAHPDDEVLIAGGTLAAAAAAGVPTGVVCLTRGEEGPIADAEIASRASLGSVRLRELTAACAELRVGFVKCFRRQDGNLMWSSGSEIARQLEQLIRAHRPDAVITFGEDGLYWHPDHIATYRFTLRALRRLERPPDLYRAIWPRELSYELVRELNARGLPYDLWGLGPEDFGVDEDDRRDEVVVDVRRFAHRKLRALRCHRTQLGGDHALSVLPDELVGRLLGIERFTPFHVGFAGGWLERTLEGAAVA